MVEFSHLSFRVKFKACQIGLVEANNFVNLWEDISLVYHYVKITFCVKIERFKDEDRIYEGVAVDCRGIGTINVKE